MDACARDENINNDNKQTYIKQNYYGVLPHHDHSIYLYSLKNAYNSTSDPSHPHELIFFWNDEMTEWSRLFSSAMKLYEFLGEKKVDRAVGVVNRKL